LLAKESAHRLTPTLQHLRPLIGALPRWSYSGGWGYYPSGLVSILLIIVIILLLAGRI
jgi:hypothetical protein